MLSSISIVSPSTLTFSPKLLSPIPKSSFFNALRIQPISLSPISSKASSSSSSVVMMAKRDEELKEIRAKTTEQINDEIIDLKGDLLMLRLQKSARNEFKASEFRRMRKKIARMLTVRRERELEEGINKRLSRKLDRQWKKSIVVRPAPSLKKFREEEAAEKAAAESS
ncbi:large ribosomal subunit protein uL29c [Cannabis sativa]|uniref:large ribosomal subunit protein uL29c n=1 Tax=Cannabis sativa TaxID=3483 RepID=UPI0029CA9AB3|nr:large ribosomal subunit protein uL29c [Cannabis sativa]